ncbi:MAG: PAS-domain containing protein, partial [Pseudomonadota bacterium]
MTHSLVNPADSLERQNDKLRTISEALMRRVEQDTTRAGAAYAQFERTALLEDEVRQRTTELERALDLLNQSNAALAAAQREAEGAHATMASALEAVEEGFALFDAQDELVLFNTRFCQHMTDVRAKLRKGMSFASYVGVVSKSRFFNLPTKAERDQWASKRRAAHRKPHVVFNVPVTDHQWIQVSEHRTPDGGTAILQTDVSHIIRAEQEKRGQMRDSQAKTLRATLDHLNQGVCIFDAQGALVDANARIRDMLAVPVSLLRAGTRIDPLIDTLRPQFDTSAEAIASIQAWVHQDEPRPSLRHELRFRNRLVLDFYAQEMPDRGFVMSFTDVTSEREAARTLHNVNASLERRVRERTMELEDAVSVAERANASKTRFVAAASHDLLQPVSAAKLYMGSLADPGMPSCTTAT